MLHWDVMVRKNGMKAESIGFVDLFSGCGGLTEGIMASGGFDALAHMEWELPMVETLRYRLVKAWGHDVEEARERVVHFDIQRVGELLHGEWGMESEAEYGRTNASAVKESGLIGLVGDRSVEVVVGGPPCQAYSIAGRAQDPNSMADDYRNYLFESFLGVVEELKPKLFVFENVAGMLSAKPGGVAITERVHKAFADAGYDVLPPHMMKRALYNTAEFGVPQARRRVIIIGVLSDGPIDLERCYELLDLQKMEGDPVTVKDAIGDLPPILPLSSPEREGMRNVSHRTMELHVPDGHEPRYHNKRDQGIFRGWVEQGMNSWSLKEKLAFYTEMTGRESNHAKYRSLEWDKPSPTVVAHLKKDGLMFIHPDPEQARSITVREAALLQSFPEDYAFLGSQATCYKMIGNAVPPGFSKAIGNAVRQAIMESRAGSVAVMAGKMEAA